MAEFTKTFIVQETWGRLATLTHIYAEMAEDAYAGYLNELANRIPEPSDDDYSQERVDQDNLLTKLGIQSIVFTAMTLEAGIFDLAAINLGDEISTTHLDKLDLQAKWVVVPQLICGSSMRVDGAALNNLRSLVKARNRLVHHKSMPWGEDIDASIAKMEATSQRFAQDVQASFKTLVLISLELADLVGDSGPLPWFNPERVRDPFSKRSPLVQKVIADCRVTHQKAALGPRDQNESPNKPPQARNGLDRPDEAT